MDERDFKRMSRRELFRLSGRIGGAAILGSAVAFRSRESFGEDFGTSVCSGQGVIETYPTSPLVGGYIDASGVVKGAAFTQELPIPLPMQPSDPATWTEGYPLPGRNQQDSDFGRHQIWPSDLNLPDPIYYKIDVEHAGHSFTNLRALPIDPFGNPTANPATGVSGPQALPLSYINSFNGTFPGPMIYGRYGQPACVRFCNHLDQPIPAGLDPCDFGAPDRAFLTHLHNGHTACESDGNPHDRPTAYRPGEWCDNLWLNWPAGGDYREKQSFLWFHDHRMDHTGANVYKGFVGLMPLYDPEQNRDNGDERKGYRLPGVPNKVTGRVDYDIPLALFDCRLNDGVTPHQDFHNGCGETHPEWWGKTFFRHFPNHGFVGDVFTVNGVAYPTLTVKRRRYRLRFLDASIARIYEVKLMQGVPQAVPGQQGQYNLFNTADANSPRGGEQCMKFVQIATDGGLLPAPILRDSFELWPAKRREVIVDFSKYMDGTPTTKGDVIYLTNVLPMSNGRKPDDEDEADPTYAVPLLKIVIGDDAPDNSIDPAVYRNGTMSLKRGALRMRPLPPLPKTFKGLPRRTFELKRSGKFGGETEWLINDLPFNPTVSLARPVVGAAELWVIRNGGGGWVHPLHLHMEEHQVISRNGIPAPDARHPDDRSREDVVALDPSEEVLIYRKFRTFKGPYVTHCHNLAHEDHAMMFGWEIV